MVPVAGDWLADYEARKAAEEPGAKAALREALDELQRLGVRTVYLGYEGEDGAASIFGLAFEPQPASEIPESLQEAVRTAAYWLLPPGWEVGGGSFGTMAIDVLRRKATRDHTRRVRFAKDNEEFDL
jgi:hypothetical protein